MHANPMQPNSTSEFSLQAFALGPTLMLQPSLPIPPSADFWHEAARALLRAAPALLKCDASALRDLSGMRVVVPAFSHAQQLKSALGRALGGTFLPPRIVTIGGWLALQPPQASSSAAGSAGLADNQRLMSLYAELRQHPWLKKLFAAKRNADLLPLAQTVLALSDELTAALLPAMQTHAGSAEQRWQAALDQLPVSAQSVLSQESQLVWSIWQSQLDLDDPGLAFFNGLMALAAHADTPLVWFAAVAPDPFAQAFLERWGERQPVLPIVLDWRAAALDRRLAQAWPELLTVAAGPQPVSADLGSRTEASESVTRDGLPASESESAAGFVTEAAPAMAELALFGAASLEDEAQCGAQTIVDWLAEGRQSVAIVAQDRVAARRIRALLQRAQIQVADETGWKLSTTRAAAALVSWFDVVSSRAESTALLDFLKSPFHLAGLQVKGGDKAEGKTDLVMAIELALRRANVAGGWRAVAGAVPEGAARLHLQQLAACAGGFQGRHAIAGWLAITSAALATLGIQDAFIDDAAGVQVQTLLIELGNACADLGAEFSFAEWRAFVSLQLEATSFLPPIADRRVIMLPLNGTHLRSFDAVLFVGADAGHLPSTASETLFFANAVRRELGLTTRETRQLQQLRDFAELLAVNRTVVLSWQAQRDGEPNPVSNWIARLELSLARSDRPALKQHAAPLTVVNLAPRRPRMPTPVAPALLPARLSASGYTSLVACPYQFFATRMLGLSGLEELSEQLEKRDYGDWLHQILHLYHVGIRDRMIALEQRAAYLQEISMQIFATELARSGAALGYVDRWQKAMPAYLEWANAREAAGWKFVTGEEWRQQPLRWSGGEILLHGRIDRIDANADGAVAVLDYKTSSPSALKKRMERNEDHQLAFYGLLSDTVTDGAGYVALEPHKDRIDHVAAPDYGGWQEQLRQQIADTMQAIAAGAVLPASGIETVCQYCPVRGLCRKGAW